MTGGTARQAAGRGRDLLAAWCRFLLVLSLLAMVLVGYATRVVFDADTFAQRASVSLTEPAVAEFVAEHLADAVIEQNRDLLAFRPVLVLTARSVVTSEPFRAVFRRTARTVHEVALSRHAETVYVSIPDASLLLRSALAQSDAEILDNIPDVVREDISGDLQRIFGDRALALLSLGTRMHRFVFWLRVTTLILLILGVAMAVDRRRALMQAGVAIGAAAFFLFWLPEIGAGLLQMRLRGAPLQSLAVAIWHALAGGLHVLALVVAGIGLVLAAAASALARRLTLQELFQRGWSILQKPLSHPLWEIARALGLVALGLFTVLQPMVALRGLMILIGAFLAFEGLTILFARLAPSLERMSESTAAERRFRAARWRWVLPGGLALALLAAGAVFLDRPPEAPAVAFTGTCNGEPELCDRPMDRVVFAGAHNAMAAADVEGWMFPNQERGLASQLRDGIRALFVDVHYGMPVSGSIRTELEDESAARHKYEAVIGKEGVDAAMRIRDRLVGEPDGPRAPYLCHGFCELGARPLVPALEEVRSFLVQNPGEVLLVVVEDYVTPMDLAAAFEAAGLGEFIFRGAPRPPWPTLGKMIASDQRLLVLAENSSAGVDWIHPAFEVIQETPYGFHAPEEFSCAPNRGGTQGSLLQLNHWVETAPAPKPSNAAVVNARDFLLQRVRQCERARQRQVNLIAVDFYRTGDLMAVVAELNLRGDPGRALTQAGSTRATTTVMLSGPPR